MDCETALEACARGDRAAIKFLFETEGPRLLGVAQRILRRRDLAEEAVQEGFIQIWRNADRFDRALGSGRGWIFAIVRFRALNILRDGRREVAVPDEAMDSLREDILEQAWDGLGEKSELRHCLGRLEPVPRRALLLAYVMGYTQGEIAGRIGAPLGTVKSWIRRALVSLRECMT